MPSVPATNPRVTLSAREIDLVALFVTLIEQVIPGDPATHPPKDCP